MVKCRECPGLGPWSTGNVGPKRIETLHVEEALKPLTLSGH